MEFAAVLFLVALLLMARAEKSLPLAMLFKIIAFDLIIVCPVWLLVWKYRSELKKYLSQNGFILSQFHSAWHFGNGFTRFQS